MVKAVPRRPTLLSPALLIRLAVGSAMCSSGRPMSVAALEPNAVGLNRLRKIGRTFLVSGAFRRLELRAARGFQPFSAILRD